MIRVLDGGCGEFQNHALDRAERAPVRCPECGQASDVKKTNVESRLSARYVKRSSVIAAVLDPVGAEPYEIALELYLGDESSHRLTVDIETAKKLGIALIEQAVIAKSMPDPDCPF